MFGRASSCSQAAQLPHRLVGGEPQRHHQSFGTTQILANYQGMFKDHFIRRPDGTIGRSWIPVG